MAVEVLSNGSEARRLPSLGNRSQLGIHQRNVFIPRIPEVDEPLTVDALCSFLKEPDTTDVVLNEFVVGGQYCRNFVLGR
jgi:hypothetical protein